MAPSADIVQVHRIHQQFKKYLKKDVVRETFIDCGRDIKKCCGILQERLASMRQKNVKEEPCPGTKEHLKQKITQLYNKKDCASTSQAKSNIQTVINQEVIKWNEQKNTTDIFDLHWMNPNGAAAYAMQVVDRLLWQRRHFKGERHAKEKSTDHLQIVTGTGKHSANGTCTIKTELLKRLREHTFTSNYSVTVSRQNPGMVVIHFK